MNATTIIASIQTVQTGGGILVDFVTLKNGKIITISDECVVVHPDMESAMDGTGDRIEGVIYFHLAD